MARNSAKKDSVLENGNGTGVATLETSTIPPQSPSAPPIDTPVTTPVSNPVSEASAIGEVHRTVTVVDRSRIAPVATLPRALRLNPEQEWPQATLLKTEPEARQLIDRIFQNGRNDYNIRVVRQFPTYQDVMDCPQGPTRDIDEFLKYHAGKEASGYRVSVFHVGGMMVASYMMRFGNAGGVGNPIENVHANPEVAAKAAELKTVQLDQQIQEVKGGGNQVQAVLAQQAQHNREMIAAFSANKFDFTGLITALAPVLAVILKPKDDTGMEKMFQMLMKQQSDAMTAAREDRKFMAEVQQKQTEMMMKAIEGKKAGGGEMNMMQMMQLMRDMKNDIREDFERMLPKDEDDVEIDPNNLWGSVAAQGIGGLIKAFKTGSPAAMGAIAAVLSNIGKAKPEDVTPLDLPALNQELQRRGIHATFAPIQQQPQLMTNIPHAPVVPSRAATLPDMPPPVFNPRSSTPPPMAMENSLEPLPEVPELAGAESIASTNDIMREDLRQELEISAENMLSDILSGRIGREEPTWTENAAFRWHESYLNELEALPSPVDVMEAVKKSIGGSVWSKIESALAEMAAKGEPPHYQFNMSFGTLMEHWKQIKEQRKAPPAQEGKKDA